MFHAIIEQPLYNILTLIASVLPTHDLGLAIILLTLLIKTVLLGPTLKSMKAGAKMQEIQPKLKEIQEKYKGNQTKISEETMKLWKEHKVNPFGSCLPILIQMPILFGLFYVIKSDIAAWAADVYTFLEGVINVNVIDPFFLGILDLSQPEKVYLPLVLWVLQYIQIRLSFAGNQSLGKEQKTIQQVMSFMFPMMIMLMAVKFQSGVALYWLTSTVYAIFQQFYINARKKKMAIASPIGNVQEATIISEKEVKKIKKNKAVTVSEKINLEDKAIERAKEKEAELIKNKSDKKDKKKVNVTRIEI